MTALIPLDSVPAVIQRECAALAEIVNPLEMVDVERRAAAIAELTKRAGLAVPIQNEATFYRAEALERLAVLVDEGQRNGEINANHRPRKVSEARTLPVPRQRLAEGRSLVATGALAEMREKAEREPDKPISMDAILKQAKRREREGRLREATASKERDAREAGLTHELVVSDLHEWRPTCDSIITDPPYVGDSIPLYEALRDFAVDVLPEGGPLVVMTWQAILPDVFRALDHEALVYRWTICWRYANVENTVDHTRRVFDCWKPVLVFHKGAMPADAPMLRDEIANAVPDKDYHEWGQSLEGFERLVRAFSEAGQVVCDPFVGGGTTAIAALANHRNFVGADVDAVAVNTTRVRLNELREAA